MFTTSIFTSFVALNVFLASIGQGQVEANVLRRGTAGHGGRQAHVIWDLLNVAGHDESFNKRQTGCNVGFYPCSDGVGCCPNGQKCSHLKNGSPTCCCAVVGGKCNRGYLPCSSNPALCCPKHDVCTSDGGCVPAGSGGGSDTITDSPPDSSTIFSSESSLSSSSSTPAGSGGGFDTITNPLPTSSTTFSNLYSSSSTPSSGTSRPPTSSSTSGEAGLRAGTTAVVMGSVIVASGLVMLIL